MSRELTEEEVLAKSVAAIPEPLDQIYSSLYNEVAWLHLKWKNYRALFGKDQETIALLNRAAPSFFVKLSQIMFEDILLHLCRLTDSPRVYGADLLTIQQFRSRVLATDLMKSIRPQIRVAVRNTKFARDRRNRRLAHSELSLHTSKEAKPLPKASRQLVEDALEAIRIVMNSIEKYYLGGPIAYKLAIDAPGDAESLLLYLESGINAERIKWGGTPGRQRS